MKSAALVLILFSFYLPLAAFSARLPNILWIVAEDLSPFFGCYGDTVNQGHTPTVDQLAAEGILFKRAYAVSPVCSSSRSALITGVMQTTTGTHQHRSSRSPEHPKKGDKSSATIHKILGDRVEDAARGSKKLNKIRTSAADFIK